jgi:hypothetical protein
VFYHIFSKVETWGTPIDCNLTREEAIQSYFIPYLKNEPFTIEGKIQGKEDLEEGLGAFESKETVEDIISRLPAYASGRKPSKYDALRKNARPCAQELMAETKKLPGVPLKRPVPSPTEHHTSINIAGSTLTNSPVSGTMDHSAQTITVNKPEIEDWLEKIMTELEKNNVQNEEMTSAIETLRAAIQAPKPSGIIIRNIIETIKSIGYGVISSAVYNHLMAHPPL